MSMMMNESFNPTADELGLGTVVKDLQTYLATPEGQKFLLDNNMSGGIYPTVTPPTPVTGGSSTTGNKVTFAPNPDARNTIKAVLSTYGLGDLADVLWTNYASGLVDISNEQALIYSIRETPTYQQRFAGNAARVKKGLPELSPSDYIALENYYRRTMQSSGMPTGFYDQTSDFADLIANDVSPQELDSRIQDGYSAVANADPEVKRQMQELYGVSEGQLAAYFLDPQKATPVLKRQAQAAQIAARAQEQGGIQITGSYAENLASRGITEQQARAGFAEIGALGELRQTFAGETALSNEQLANAAFGLDVQAQQELERRKRLRTGEFAGGGQFARTTGATSGSIETAVGKAQ
jgi:hypothetical protein